MTLLNDFEASLDHFAHNAVSIEGETFGVTGDKWLDGIYKDSSVEIFPGIFQHTEEFARFKWDLFQRLQESVAPAFSKEGYHYSSPNQVLVDWGSKASAVLPPMEDNAQLRKDLSLRSADEDEEKLIVTLLRHVFSNGKPDTVRIKDISSSGFPYMQRGREFKYAIMRRAYHGASRLVDLTANHDWLNRLSEFGSYPAFTNGIRVQADKVRLSESGLPFTKERFTYDIADLNRCALRGGEPTKIPIDMRVFIDGEQHPELVSGRVRSMFALSYDDNCILQALNNWLAQGLKAFDCCVYAGELEEAKKMQLFLGGEAGYIYTLDKVQFGETFSPRNMELFLQVMAEYFAPEFCKFVRVTLDALTFFRGARKGEQGVQLTRSTVSKSEELSLQGSFKSGHALVAVLGKLNGLIDCMLISRKALGASFSFDRFVENKLPDTLIASFSDDTKFCHRTESTYSKFRKAIEGGSSLHKDELEEGALYLGWYYDKFGNPNADLGRFLERMTGTERSYKSKSFHADGIKASMQRYSINPLFWSVFDILNECYIEHYGFDVLAYCQKAKLSSLTFHDQIFLEDPDKIFYYPDLNPSPELVEAEFSHATVEEVASMLRKFQ